MYRGCFTSQMVSRISSINSIIVQGFLPLVFVERVSGGGGGGGKTHLRFQWLFLVPLKGGRWHLIPQLAVYTTYIPLVVLAFVWGLLTPYCKRSLKIPLNQAKPFKSQVLNYAGKLRWRSLANPPFCSSFWLGNTEIRALYSWFIFQLCLFTRI